MLWLGSSRTYWSLLRRRVANVLNALPKSAWRTARRMLADIRDAEDREHAVGAIDAFAAEFGAKWSEAVAKVVDDATELLAFYDFPGRLLPDRPLQEELVSSPRSGILRA